MYDTRGAQLDGKSGFVRSHAWQLHMCKVVSALLVEMPCKNMLLGIICQYASQSLEHAATELSVEGMAVVESARTCQNTKFHYFTAFFQKQCLQDKKDYFGEDEEDRSDCSGGKSGNDLLESWSGPCLFSGGSRGSCKAKTTQEEIQG